MKMRRKVPWTSALLALVLVAGSATWFGCGERDSVVSPSSEDPALAGAARFGEANEAIFETMRIQERHTADLLGHAQVVGTATSVDESGNPVVLVLTKTEVPEASLPYELEGVRVVQEVCGEIRAMKGPGGGGGGGGVSHTAKQTPPIKMGTSGGWRYDLANGYCCGGTLGSLIQVGGQKRILSNYHVFEADIVNGGNSRRAQTGDPVIQPALIDVNCNANNAQNVATLVVSGSLPGSNVDASSATVVPGMVDETGNILEVGTISSSTVAAFVNQAVKKSGRTSGLTRSTIAGLNATINVQYENECAGGVAFTKQFTGQIVINNKGSKFLQGGDSGSLMIEDVTSNARAVGLLFAGSNQYAFANPIGQVLNFFGATMVGS